MANQSGRKLETRNRSVIGAYEYACEGETERLSFDRWLLRLIDAPAALGLSDADAAFLDELCVYLAPGSARLTREAALHRTMNIMRLAVSSDLRSKRKRNARDGGLEQLLGHVPDALIMAEANRRVRRRTVPGVSEMHALLERDGSEQKS